jgi:small subunit ribosomal protein S20
MPHTKSAKKRHRQSLERRTRNRAVKSTLKTEVRKVHELVKAGDTAKVTEQFRLLSKKADQAAAKGIIHRNAAARIKSRASAVVKAGKPATAAK